MNPRAGRALLGLSFPRVPGTLPDPMHAWKVPLLSAVVLTLLPALLAVARDAPDEVSKLLLGFLGTESPAHEERRPRRRL